MAAQGPETTIKVKVIISKCGPDISGDDYIHLIQIVTNTAVFTLVYATKTPSL